MRLTKLGHSCVRLDKDGATLVIDPPVATTGQCGEATFTDGTDESCRLLSAGAKLLCK